MRNILSPTSLTSFDRSDSVSSSTSDISNAISVKLFCHAVAAPKPDSILALVDSINSGSSNISRCTSMISAASMD